MKDSEADIAIGVLNKLIDTEKGIEMSEETLEPPLPPIDARTEAVAERLFGLKFALRKDDPKHIHDEWEHAADWIHDGYLRKPSKCSPPPTKRNPRAPRPPATRTACVSSTGS